MTLRSLTPFLACLCLPTLADGKLLRIATGELPPYATQSRADQGIALNVVRRAFETAGYRVQFTFLPWSRALAEARTGKWTGTAYWGHKPEHEESFFLSDNVLTEQWVFVYRAKSGFDWQTLADLRPYRMAIIQDYTYTPQLWSMVKSGELQADLTPNDLSSLRKLISARVDIAPMEKNVACDLLARHFGAGSANLLRYHPRLMTDQFTTHLMLSRKLPDSFALVTAFNAGLKKIQASGEHAKLLSQVRCPTAWAVDAGADSLPRVANPLDPALVK
ncbi:amino acid ABC transporter substrate-binding protein [Chitinimonas arctica]|uniref:Amino acid ABC transporter substrate-binding protein n=1 Tax=Chitinimonas arctica TaxID=2594795 RepID=A0A516SF81_9NEIS|nr:transporter substrate-binding domain-containing protein [Chitinimonas arctica]QDQ26819.1 amino acid ABC transporter substrate-binding protein [Chitinimonas arctica]